MSQTVNNTTVGDSLLQLKSSTQENEGELDFEKEE